MKNSVVKSAAMIVAFASGGCAQHGVGLPASPSVQDAGTVQPAFAASGTFKGTIVEQESGNSRSGTVVITVHQSGRKISGSFDVTLSGKTDDLTISGSVKSLKKSKARIAFEISDPKGRYAAATATVGVKRLTGKATVPATSSRSAVHLAFKTKRTK